MVEYTSKLVLSIRPKGENRLDAFSAPFCYQTLTVGFIWLKTFQKSFIDSLKRGGDKSVGRVFSAF